MIKAWIPCQVQDFSAAVEAEFDGSSGWAARPCAFLRRLLDLLEAGWALRANQSATRTDQMKTTAADLEDARAARSLTVANLGHREGALETAAHAAVDTLRFPPARVADADKLIGLVARELLGALLHDGGLRQGGDFRHLGTARREMAIHSFYQTGAAHFGSLVGLPC